MRKVMYQYWIPRQVQPKKDLPRMAEDVPGTNCFSEPQSGYFHGWGFEMHEDSTTIAMDSVAIVEDCTTGHIHSVSPQKMRFVLPPEKNQAPEVIGQLIINDATGVEIIEWLKSIDAKLKTL